MPNQPLPVRRRGVRRISTTAVLAATLTLGAAAGDTKIAFVTSATGNGQLSTWPQAAGATGLAAGDDICQSLAADADLPEPETFRAWLSTASNDAFCRMRGLSGTRANRCFLPPLVPLPPAGPWVRTDGFPFAGAIDEMLAPDGVVLASLELDENGDPVGTGVWTGTTATGAAASKHCTGWTSTSDTGEFGSSERSTEGWTTLTSGTCNAERPIYCLQTGAGDSLPPMVSGGRVAFVASLPLPGNMQVDLADLVCRTSAGGVGLANSSTFKSLAFDAFLRRRRPIRPRRAVGTARWCSDRRGSREPARPKGAVERHRRRRVSRERERLDRHPTERRTLASPV